MRRWDWPETLSREVAKRRTAAFEWGDTKNDCVSFPAFLGLLWELPDLLKGLRTYTTERGALLKLSRAGYVDDDGVPSLEKMLMDRLPEIPVAKAGRGDIALIRVDGPFGSAARVILGSYMCGPSDYGMVFEAKSSAYKAFRFD